MKDQQIRGSLTNRGRAAQTHDRLDRLALLMVFLFVLASRLPFLGPGYGVDADGWRVVLVGKHLAETGEYLYSRQPGYPLQEAVGALVARHPYCVGNSITAGTSAIAALLFYAILRSYGVRDGVLGAFAMALTPVIFVESVGMMDYMNALACLMGAMYAILARRTGVAGLLVAVAAGFRASSAAMVIPFSLFLLTDARHEARAVDRLKSLARLTLISGGATLLIYAVPLSSHGMGLIESYQVERRPWLPAIWLATVGVFGLPGTFAIGIGLFRAAWGVFAKGASGPWMPGAPARNDLLMWLVAAAIPFLIFLWQPSESGYLIPAVPFILLLIARYTTRLLFILVCLAIFVSPFVGQLTPRVGHMVPSILTYQAARNSEMRQIKALWDYLATQPVRTMIITGSAYWPKLWMTQPAEMMSRVTLTSWVTAEDIISEQSTGTEVLCFGRACAWNTARTGTDPIQLGAKPFP
jgi:hypothetical protein